ncbi:MAG: hypothetical protein IKE15_00770 [Clostridia bacterium]|nr:hypothetical protein [Clostridia bacterium]
MSDYSFDYHFVKAGAPIVTINATGIAFNAIVRSMLNHPQFVAIGFDADRKAIGIRPATETEDADVYPFESREKNGWIRIGCREFVKHLSDITGMSFIDKATQFSARKTGKDLEVVVDINVDNVR